VQEQQRAISAKHGVQTKRGIRRGLRHGRRKPKADIRQQDDGALPPTLI